MFDKQHVMKIISFIHLVARVSFFFYSLNLVEVY